MIVDFLKKYKWAYSTSNFFNRKKLKHNLPLYKKYQIDKAYFQSLNANDFDHLPPNLPTHDVKNSKDELIKKEDFKKLDEKTQQSLLNWSDNGYVVLESFYQKEEVDLINDEVEKLLQQKKISWNDNRIMFAIKKSALLASAATFPKLKSCIDLIMDKEMELFQSINFYESSQQRTHSDSIHMSTYPKGNIIAVWIALEDVGIEDGPLHFYPGSHKLPYIMNSDFGNNSTSFKLGDKSYGHYEDKIAQILEENKQLEKKLFLAKKGDILIWHANLLHGAELKTNPKASRKSMVFHYYAKDAIAFHEITERPTLKHAF